MERLDKLLADNYAGSRKKARELIKQGSVSVNDVVCKAVDTKINPQTDSICVNGQPISGEKFIYLMMNKPSGVVSATKDNVDKTVIDILPDEYRRRGLFPAGRLDKDTEGLLIITNDGDFAHRMLSPKKHVEKKYVAMLDGEITEDTIKAFEDGIIFADGTKCMPAKLEIAQDMEQTCGIVTICEGKFHQVKKMFAVCGLKVVQLTRISIGNLYLDSKLPIGSCKKLTNLEKELIFMGNMH